MLVLMIDALDKGYLDYLPNLKKLGEQNLTAESYSPAFGFEHRHYVLASKYPDEINYFCLYSKSKSENNLKFLKYLSFIDWIPEVRVNNVLRNIISKYISKSRNYFNYDLSRIPLKYAHKFDMLGDKKSLTETNFFEKDSLLDVLSKNNLKYYYCWYPYPAGLSDDDKKIESVKEIISKNNHDIIFLHLSALDRIGHRFGPQSEEIKLKLKELDKEVSDLIKQNNLKFIIFGDHGMKQVDETIDYRPIVKSLNKNNEPTFFVDSTMIRFWNISEQELNEILKPISSKGYLITSSLRKELHANFKDDSFGEYIFVLKAGKVFYPDFFNSYIPKGMHGYLPDEDSSFLICSSEVPIKRLNCSDVDVAPTILSMLNIKVPNHFSGNSLL